MTSISSKLKTVIYPSIEINGNLLNDENKNQNIKKTKKQ
jgi:hypothetical protein